MAPRAPESVAQLVARLRAGAATLATEPVRFGAPHHTHRAANGIFMPEHAEFLSEPTGEIELEADSLEGLIDLMQSSRIVRWWRRWFA